jgi:hypothetical protein
VTTTEPSLSNGNPYRSPTYPQRVHIRERAQWQKVLADVEARVRAAQQSSNAQRPGAERLLAQMAGARDQIAEAVRRLPMEVGDLYEEDHHRVHEAEQALTRLFAKFGA